MTNKQAWSEGAGWLPIGDEQNPFTSVLNGNDKKISNLFIYRPSADAVGLIAALGEDGRIDNIGLSDITVVGNSKVGALAGMSHGAIVNSHAHGKVDGQSRVGGLVGESDAAIVTSYTDVAVNGEHYVGGLVGLNEGSITSCYTKGDVLGKDSGIGGFVGSNVGGIIQNNYAHGDVEGIDNVGGFVGSNRQRGVISYNYATGKVTGGGENVGGFSGANTGVVYSQNYWDIQTSGIRTSTLANFGLDTVALKVLADEDIYAGWSNAAWHFETGVYPHLKHVTGIAITNLSVDAPACGILSSFTCGKLLAGQRVGLADLYIADEGLNLLPKFHNQIYDYRLTVYADARHIQFVPIAYLKSIAYDKSAVIRISNGRSFSENVASATTTSAIPLNTVGATMITIAVQVEDDKTIQYIIAVMRHDFLNADERVDRDGDGLIELNYLEDLHAIRYQLDGSGYRTSLLDSKFTLGCASGGCLGYELVRDLDFEDPSSYRNASRYAATRIESRGWLPIGEEKNPFAGRFNGNGYTIANFAVNKPQSDNVALFAQTAAVALIDQVVLSGVDLSARHQVGGLVAVNEGTIKASQVDGSITGHSEVGGMVGHNAMGAEINASFAAVLLRGHVRVGGLVGSNEG